MTVSPTQPRLVLPPGSCPSLRAQLSAAPTAPKEQKHKPQPAAARPAGTAEDMSTTTAARLRAVAEAAGLDLADIQRAAARICGVARVTPVRTSAQLDSLLAGLGPANAMERAEPQQQQQPRHADADHATRFFFKLEPLQHTGSFKFRGAYNAVAALAERNRGTVAGSEDADGGHPAPVVTHSSGNHGQAVACAANMLGRPAYVVIPRNAPAVKIAAARLYGAQVVQCGPTMAERIAAAEGIVKRVGGILLTSALSPDVFAGQGTIALELHAQIQDLDAIIAPIGCGSLISGIAVAAKSLNPGIRVIGVEPVAGNDAARSFKAGYHIQAADTPETIADGLRAPISALAWTVISSLVDAILTVSEQEIVRATKLVWSHLKVVIEPSSGVAVAAAMSSEFKALGLKRVAVILSGGNVDVDKLSFIPE